jgi:hypothetical protein
LQPYDDYITMFMEDRASQAIALMNKLQDLSPPLTAQAKLLLLSRSLQRRLTHFSCLVSPPLALRPLTMLQIAAETTAFSILNIPADFDKETSMGLH